MAEPKQHGVRFGFSVGQELTAEVLRTIEQVRSDPGGKETVTALVDTVLELTDFGLREYYVRPLEQARAGTIALGTARVGISTARRGISLIVNKVLRGMNEDQLLSIADSLEDLLIRGSEQ